MAWAVGRTSRACSCMSPADVHPRDNAVYWGFSRSNLDRLGRLAGLRRFELVDAPKIAGHPPILGTLEKD
jgi:hypothetical protein